MNAAIREVLKSNNNWNNCDLVAIRNNNESYYVLRNRNGKTNGVVSDIEFKDILMDSKEPIVLSSSLFKSIKNIRRGNT